MSDLKTYATWDRSVRAFHWINLLCMIGLIAVGVAILNDKALGVTNEGKILLKSVHAWIGYVFALNLLWRLVWAFIGGPRARWRAILPGGRGYLGEVGSYVSAFSAGRPRQWGARVHSSCLTMPIWMEQLKGWSMRFGLIRVRSVAQGQG